MLEGGGGVEFHARADEAVQLDGNRLVVEIAVEIEKMELENDFRGAVLPDGGGVADIGDAVEGLPVGEAPAGCIDAVWRNQKLRDGEPLGGRASAESDFEDEDDEDFLS